MTKTDGLCTHIAYLYTLADPATGAVRYVGRTVNPLRRAGAYTLGRDFEGTPVDLWARNLRVAGKPADFVVRAVVPRADSFAAEDDLIRSYADAGADLLNIRSLRRRVTRRVVAQWRSRALPRYRSALAVLLDCGHLRYHPEGRHSVRRTETCHVCSSANATCEVGGFRVERKGRG